MTNCSRLMKSSHLKPTSQSTTTTICILIHWIKNTYKRNYTEILIKRCNFKADLHLMVRSKWTGDLLFFYCCKTIDRFFSRAFAWELAWIDRCDRANKWSQAFNIIIDCKTKLLKWSFLFSFCNQVAGQVQTVVTTFRYIPTDVMAVLVNDSGVSLRETENQALFQLRMKSFYRQSNDIQVPTIVSLQVRVSFISFLHLLV